MGQVSRALLLPNISIINDVPVRNNRTTRSRQATSFYKMAADDAPSQWSKCWAWPRDCIWWNLTRVTLVLASCCPSFYQALPCSRFRGSKSGCNWVVDFPRRSKHSHGELVTSCVHVWWYSFFNALGNSLHSVRLFAFITFHNSFSCSLSSVLVFW